MSIYTTTLRKGLAASAVTLLLGISACSDDDKDALSLNDDTSITGSKVAIATRAAGNTSGRIDLHSVATGDLSLSYPATGSDIRAASDGTNVYQIARYQMDHITQFTAATTDVAYQYSVNGEENSVNPYQLVFATEDKAYLLRYNSDKIWIINPNADSEANFKLGELDISAYDTDAPNANSATIVGDKLFVLMERLNGYAVEQQGYVAVFDTTTDTEINTAQGTANGLLGIPVGVQNPESLHYVNANGLLYLTGRGNIYAADASAGNRFTGGIVTIDPESYIANMLLDDGTEEDNQGFFKGAAVIDASAAYLLSYTGGFYGDDTLRRFNPTTGTLTDEAIAGLENKQLTVIAEAPNKQLWVGVSADSPYVERIDVDTDTSAGSFTTELVPINFAFFD